MTKQQDLREDAPWATWINARIYLAIGDADRLLEETKEMLEKIQEQINYYKKIELEFKLNGEKQLAEEAGAKAFSLYIEMQKYLEKLCEEYQQLKSTESILKKGAKKIRNSELYEECARRVKLFGEGFCKDYKMHAKCLIAKYDPVNFKEHWRAFENWKRLQKVQASIDLFGQR